MALTRILIIQFWMRSLAADGVSVTARFVTYKKNEEGLGHNDLFAWIDTISCCCGCIVFGELPRLRLQVSKQKLLSIALPPIGKLSKLVAAPDCLQFLFNRPI